LRTWLLSILLFSSLAARANLELPAEATCAQLLENKYLTEMVFLNLGELEKYPGHWSAASQRIMMALIEHFSHRELDFAYFEKFFRANDIPLYLVASSEVLQPELGRIYPPALETFKGRTPLYHLWVGIRGKDEADQFKKELGISNGQNLIRLSHTGLLFAENGEKAAATDRVTLFSEGLVNQLAETKVAHLPTPHEG
jgi:hypothetical protein